MLELRWEMMALDDELDFFVRECVAERGGSSPMVHTKPTTPKPVHHGYGGGGGGGGGDETATVVPEGSTVDSLKLIEKG